MSPVNSARSSLTPSDLDEVCVGKGHAHILGLPAVNPAAERPAAVFIGTVIHIPALAEPTFAAVGLYIYAHPVARAHVVHGGAGLLHHAHKLVADGYALHRARHRAPLYVQVARADARERHPDHRVTRALKFRHGLLREFKFSVVYVCICQHFCPLIIVYCAALRQFCAYIAPPCGNLVYNFL